MKASLLQTIPRINIMQKKAIIIFLLLSYITVSSYAQQNKVDVTYVGNAGFLINIGDKKILIDALFKGFKGNYNLPQKIQDKLTLAQAPFDDVDLILVTHAHGDHANPDMVQQHLQNNPKAIFASTQQMVNSLNGFTDRCIVFNPTKEKSESKVIDDISIEAFSLPHGTNAKTINIGFLISVNGITIFQTGDADFDQFTFAEFRELQLPERNIDLSFIQHYYLRGDSLSTKFVREAIGGNYIVPIHYHFTTPAFDKALVRQNYPDAIIFEEELQSWQMPGENDASPTLKGAYLGQTPPGLIPEIFAPDVISGNGRLHCFPAFSLDNKEIYWMTIPPKIVTMREVDGKWTNPYIVPFSNSSRNQAPFVAHDNTIYYSSNRNGGKGGLDIWTITKTNSGFTTPINIGDKINSSNSESTPTISENKTMFYSSTVKGKLYNFGIYYSIYENGEYKEPIILPEPINIMDTNNLDYTPFIAKDESYLLFCSNRQNPEKELCHIYISYKNKKGEWGNPVDLSLKMGFTKSSKFPYISPDNKFLFFSSGQNIYWVDSKIINLENK